MRAITVRQPWAWAIAHGWKPVENRVQPTRHRGVIAIHSALTLEEGARFPDRDAEEARRRAGAYWNPAVPGDRPHDDHPDPATALGAVIAVANLVDCHSAATVPRLDGTTGTCCEPWGMPGHHHLVFEGVLLLEDPIPLPGQLGVWSFQSDERLYMQTLRYGDHSITRLLTKEAHVARTKAPSRHGR
jgi:hypothetical protein